MNAPLRTLMMLLIALLSLVACKGGVDQKEKRSRGPSPPTGEAKDASEGEDREGKQALIDAVLGALSGEDAEQLLTLARTPAMLKSACPGFASAEAFAREQRERTPPARRDTLTDAQRESLDAQAKTNYEAIMSGGTEALRAQLSTAIKNCAGFDLANASLTERAGGEPIEGAAPGCGGPALELYQGINLTFKSGSKIAKIKLTNPGRLSDRWGFGGVSCDLVSESGARDQEGLVKSALSAVQGQQPEALMDLLVSFNQMTRSCSALRSASSFTTATLKSMSDAELAELGGMEKARELVHSTHAEMVKMMSPEATSKRAQEVIASCHQKIDFSAIKGTKNSGGEPATDRPLLALCGENARRHQDITLSLDLGETTEVITLRRPLIIGERWFIEDISCGAAVKR